jgi:NADH dehydrogenase
MRVAVFGAGYAGLSLARKLESRLPADVELVVVNEDAEHLVQHELHRVVRRPALAEEISIDLDTVLERATVREATVTDVDTGAGIATLADGEALSYDVGAVALGAETAFFDLPGVEENATPLKRLPHAHEIRADFLEVTASGGRVVVGGAGLSGVQLAGELAALARGEDDDGAVEIVLLEQEPRVAPGFAPAFQDAVRDALVSRGVDVRTGRSVASASADEVDLASGESIAYDQFAWTGGIRGPDALAGDRPAVRNDLRLDDRTFVLGDAARVVDANGQGVPASAQSAVREASVVAENVASLVAHDRDGDGGFEPRLDRFAFDSPGWLVSVGDGAVAKVGPSVLTGSAAKALKTSVGAGYLTSVGAVEEAADLVRDAVWNEKPEAEPAEPE